MPAERRGAFADIDGDIQHCALNHPDKLCLRVGRRLKMEPAQNAETGP